MAKCSPEKLAYAKVYRDKHRDRINAYFRSRKVARNARRQAWNVANRDRQRAVNVAHHLKRYHGLTVEQYEAMVANQRGLCAICRQPASGRKHCGKLHVDHDHVTGEIRELLCADCNRGLGLFQENPAALTRAAWYLERHRTKTCHTA